MRAGGGHGPAPPGGASVGTDGAERLQGGPGGPHRGGRRRVRQREARPVRVTPTGELQGEAGEVGNRDLRLRVCRQALVVVFRPAPVDPTRPLAPGAPGALLGRRPGHRHRDQAAQSAGQIHPCHPAQPGVDHRPHPGHGQAGLGDGGGEDHPTPARRGSQHRVLFAPGLSSVQRHHVDRAARVGQPLDDRGDLTRPG